MSAAEKLLMYGISVNAVASTPATEPIVLTKNTLPAPASPVRWSPRASTIATSSGFIAEAATSGTKSSTRHAAKAPATRSRAASVAKRCG